MKTIEQLIEDFNTSASIAFAKKYDEYSPQLHALVGTYPIGYTPATKAVFTDFLKGLQKVTSGPIPAESMPDNYFITIPNDRYGEKVEIQEADFERASGAVANLELYKRQIEGLAINAKDHPVVMALNMIEAGTSSTYGKCFDDENLFSTAHSYSTSVNQSNSLTGTGVEKAVIYKDLRRAFSALRGFKYPVGGREKKFNAGVQAIVLCPSELAGIFEDIRSAEFINGETNTLKGLFAIVDEPMNSDKNWYLIDANNQGNPICRPVINPLEKKPELKDNFGSESQKLDGTYRWQADYRGGYGYGAWWKIVKVTNA